MFLLSAANIIKYKLRVYFNFSNIFNGSTHTTKEIKEIRLNNNIILNVNLNFFNIIISLIGSN